MKLNSFELEPWRAAVLIKAAEGDGELTTLRRVDLLIEHFPEMGMAEIVELEAGAIVILRAMEELVERWRSGQLLEV